MNSIHTRHFQQSNEIKQITYKTVSDKCVSPQKFHKAVDFEEYKKDAGIKKFLEWKLKWTQVSVS